MRWGGGGGYIAKLCRLAFATLPVKYSILGLALLGLATIVCDFLLMHIEEKVAIKQKK